MSQSDLSALTTGAAARLVHARLHLYAAFQGYRPSEYGSQDGACPHCVPKDQFDDLVGVPVALLTPEQTWTYASAVWTGVPDFKYYLPRLLELVEPVSELVGWDGIERKLPEQRWLVCSEEEREAIARYLAAADECNRLAAFARTNDVAALFRPFLVPPRIAKGLPLAESLWPELAKHRAGIFLTHVGECRTAPASPAAVVLARALNGFLDGRETHTLKALLRSVVPSDDVLLSWIQSGDAEAAMAAMLTDETEGDAAASIGMALANLSLLHSL